MYQAKATKSDWEKKKLKIPERLRKLGPRFKPPNYTPTTRRWKRPSWAGRRNTWRKTTNTAKATTRRIPGW